MELLTYENLGQKFYDELEKFIGLFKALPKEAKFCMTKIAMDKNQPFLSERLIVENLAKNPSCGSFACIDGWCRVFVEQGKMESNIFSGLSKYNWRVWEFLCAYDWYYHPTEYTKQAAVARLEFLLYSHAIPENWQDQVFDEAPPTYYDKFSNQKK